MKKKYPQHTFTMKEISLLILLAAEFPPEKVQGSEPLALIAKCRAQRNRVGETVYLDEFDMTVTL